MGMSPSGAELLVWEGEVTVGGGLSCRKAHAGQLLGPLPRQDHLGFADLLFALNFSLAHSASLQSGGAAGGADFRGAGDRLWNPPGWPKGEWHGSCAQRKARARPLPQSLASHPWAHLPILCLGCLVFGGQWLWKGPGLRSRKGKRKKEAIRCFSRFMGQKYTVRGRRTGIQSRNDTQGNNSNHYSHKASSYSALSKWQALLKCLPVQPLAVTCGSAVPSSRGGPCVSDAEAQLLGKHRVGSPTDPSLTPFHVQRHLS